MQICPSILEFKTEDYFTTIKKLSPYYQYFQIDFADGIFVKSKTASIDDFISLVKKQWNHETMKQSVFDFHLMVKNYQEYIEKIETLENIIRIKNVLIHFSAISSRLNRDRNSNLSSIPIGLALNPEDKIDDLTSHYNLKEIPLVQIMSVTPGVQGNPFLPETLKKIEQLKRLGYRNKIYLDGAVNDKTIPFINEQKFKPDVICPGSFLTKTKTLEENVKYLSKL